MTVKPAKKGGTHYRIAYKVKGAQKWIYKNTTLTKVTIKNLKSGKRYVVKVQAYKTVNGEKYRGAWSKLWTSKKIK